MPACGEPLVVIQAKHEGSRFDDVNMPRTTIHNADLSALIVEDANLSGALFENVNLAGAAIRDANIQGMTIEGVSVEALFEAYRAANPGA